MLKTVVHFGAGVIGRGLVGDLLHDSGYEIVFADTNTELMRQLAERKSYMLFRINDHAKRKRIDRIRGVCTRTQSEQVIRELANADLITTAVWANNLPAVAPLLARGLAMRRLRGGVKVNVLACENAINASSRLKQEILATGVLTPEQLEHIACFPNVVVDRMVFAVTVDGMEGIEVGAEFELAVEQNQLADPGSRPIQGAEYTDNLRKYLERKLYVVNCAHVLAGFYGHLKGYAYVLASFQDPEIMLAVRAAMHESAAMLMRKYDFTQTEFDAYLEFIVRRFLTPGVRDPIQRVCRQPIRKLAAEERLIGPIRNCREHGLPYWSLCRGVAAALCYDHPADDEAQQLQAYLHRHGVVAAVSHYTGLAPDDPAVPKIVDEYAGLKQQYKK